jgi:hypothetical protein
LTHALNPILSTHRELIVSIVPSKEEDKIKSEKSRCFEGSIEIGKNEFKI